MLYVEIMERKRWVSKEEQWLSSKLSSLNRISNKVIRRLGKLKRVQYRKVVIGQNLDKFLEIMVLKKKKRFTWSVEKDEK